MRKKIKSRNGRRREGTKWWEWRLVCVRENNSFLPLSPSDLFHFPSWSLFLPLIHCHTDSPRDVYIQIQRVTWSERGGPRGKKNLSFDSPSFGNCHWITDFSRRRRTFSFLVFSFLFRVQSEGSKTTKNFNCCYCWWCQKDIQFQRRNR